MLKDTLSLSMDTGFHILKAWDLPTSWREVSILQLKTFWKGQTTLKEGKSLWHYEGELDAYGQAYGSGVAVLVDDARWIYKGTFLNNERHGFGKRQFFLDNY